MIPAFSEQSQNTYGHCKLNLGSFVIQGLVSVSIVLFAKDSTDFHDFHRDSAIEFVVYAINFLKPLAYTEELAVTAIMPSSLLYNAQGYVLLLLIVQVAVALAASLITKHRASNKHNTN